MTNVKIHYINSWVTKEKNYILILDNNIRFLILPFISRTMGCLGSKDRLSKEDMDYLKLHTRYDEGTIKEWYKGFKVNWIIIYLFNKLLKSFKSPLSTLCRLSRSLTTRGRSRMKVVKSSKRKSKEKRNFFCIWCAVKRMEFRI